MEKNITGTCKDDLRAVMRTVIGESSDTAKVTCSEEINVFASDTSHYVVCGFRYDSAKKDYYISAYRGYPYEDDESVIHEISVKDMDVEDAKALLESGALSKAERQKTAPKEAPATVFEEYKGYGYSARTYENARKADLTLALAVDFTTAGEKCTINAAGDRHIPVDLNLPVDDGRKEAVAMTILQKCSKLGLDSEHLRLNIAGNGIYTLARNGWTQERADAVVTDILTSLQNHGNIHIDSIRSGGQTGIDEAGIKAGVTLGLPTTVLAPKGWAFRTANRQDIFNETAFKARFSTNPKKELAKETPVKAHSVTADGPTWTPCRRNDGLMNYRDAAGHVLLKNWVDDALPFKDGKAECRIGKTGYIIDTKGIVIDRARWTAQSQSNTNGPKI